MDSCIDAVDDRDFVDDQEETDLIEPASVIITSSGRPPSALSGIKVPNYEFYRNRLEPLVELEERLTRMLSSPDEDEPTHLPISYPSAPGPAKVLPNSRPNPTILIPSRVPPPTNVSPSSLSPSQVSNAEPSPTSTDSRKSKTQEVSVHTSTNWKRAFALSLGSARSKSPKSAHSGEIEGWWEDPEDPVHVLHACAPVMTELWRDPMVKQRLRERRLRLEESSGL